MPIQFPILEDGNLVCATTPKLLAGIMQVQKGGSPMPTHGGRKVVPSFQRVGFSPQPSENLSTREQEILDCLAKGFLYEEIAEKPGIRYETVHTHIRRIDEKLQVRTRTEAVANFLKQQHRPAIRPHW